MADIVYVFGFCRNTFRKKETSAIKVLQNSGIDLSNMSRRIPSAKYLSIHWKIYPVISNNLSQQVFSIYGFWWKFPFICGNDIMNIISRTGNSIFSNLSNKWYWVLCQGFYSPLFHFVKLLEVKNFLHNNNMNRTWNECFGTVRVCHDNESFESQYNLTNIMLVRKDGFSRFFFGRSFTCPI